MGTRKAELRYLSRRMSDSLDMAAAAVGPCAQIAHLTLAHLYGDAIDALTVQPRRSSRHSKFSAGRDAVEPWIFAPASEERHLVSLPPE